ncbi:MAG TPA: polysaccharide deacetylase family protein [Ktedonobacteraceae bacterium]|nr:polysaccharide deacetylase family protein [Ktedonobacteraceae bacterium]
MRKVCVVLLSLLLLCWGVVLTAFANRLPAQATQISVIRAKSAVVKVIPTKVVPTPTRTMPSPVARASATPMPTPPASSGDNVNATIPAGVRENIFFNGNTSLHEVALTFDDGPHPVYTLQVLHILQEYGVKATFFCIGRQVLPYASIVAQVSRVGNVIADHTWDHFDMTRLSIASMQWELKRTANAIALATGVRPVLFRPPYGIINTIVKDVSTQLGLTPIMWNVDPSDWRLPGTDAIVQRVLANTGNGSVILMHDGGGNRSQTVQALPQIIAGLQARGFRFVTVPQLLADSARG